MDPNPAVRRQQALGKPVDCTVCFNRNADYAPPYQAVRHDLRTNGTFELPVGPGKLLFSNSSGWLAGIIEHWQTGQSINTAGILFGQIPTKGGSGTGGLPRSFQVQLRLDF
jgi:hypothetical protein